jgi:hypothetical protein
MAEELRTHPGDVADPGIPDEDSVLRRLSDSGPNMVVVDQLTGARRPSSGAFKPDVDGVSVYRRSRLVAKRLTEADLVRAPQNLVVELGIGEIRCLARLDVKDDPWPADTLVEPRHPRQAAHALIVGWDGLSRGEKRARQQTLAALPSLRFVYP